MPFTAILHIILFLCFGFIFGMLTGFFGVGGGFLITPALNILGFPMVHAIGMSFAVIVANTLVGAVKHFMLGNANLRVGVLLGLFSMSGVELGKRQVFYLEGLNLAGPYVRGAYVFFLSIISVLMLRESYRNVKPEKNEMEGMKEGRGALALWVSRIRLPPTLSISPSGADTVSIWVLAASGASVGFLSGFMGIGGGVVVFPILIYVIGIPTMMAVGTSLISTFFTSSYGTIVYAIAGRVEWGPVLVILAGSVFGVHVGVQATRGVPSMKIRVFFALFLLFIGISIFLKQIELETASICVVSGSALILSLAILLIRIKK